MIRDFLMSGRLRDVKLGMPISNALNILGEPNAVGKGLRGWTIESYSGGCLQIAHSKGVVGLIGIYFDPDKVGSPILPTALECEIPFSSRTTLCEFRNYLDEHSIAYEPDTRLRDAVALKVGAGIVANFEDDQLRSLLIS